MVIISVLLLIYLYKFLYLIKLNISLLWPSF